MINTFEDIAKQINKSLFLKQKYLSKHFIIKTKEYEFLEDHLDRCLDYFLYFIKKRNLELIYNNFLSNFFGNNYNKINKLKKIILYFIYFHDIGKLNPYFQNSAIDILKNKDIVDLDYIKVDLKEKSTEHSKYSTVIVLYFLFDDILNSNFKNDNQFIYIVFLLSTVITRHHTNLKNISNKMIGDDLDGDIKDVINLINNSKIIKYIINNLNYKFKLDLSTFKEELENKFKYILYNNGDSKLIKTDKKSTDLYFLTKLLYSNLVLADYYSSLAYTNKNNVNINVINSDLKNTLTHSFKNSKKYNDLDNYKFKSIAECENLNELRSNLLYVANENILSKLKEDNKLFMLTVPTGGGKTNISIKLILNILNFDDNVNRVYWAFPFINIIEQNYSVIKDILKDKNNDLISTIYSSNINFINTNINPIDETNYTEILANESFLNNKINIISFVNFFNSFIKIKKNNRYKIAHLCNSVVVLDEIQSLPENKLNLFYNLIKWISDKYNIYFIIMSATLPDLNYFLNIKKSLPQIIDNYLDYYNNDFFKRNRVIFRVDLNTIDKIYQLLISELHENNYNKILLTFNTISTSIKFYNLIFEKLGINYDVYLLNSNISNIERKLIISKIKNTNLKTILISTQSIEAGVDLDFDLAIRDYTILDSIEQISGRVNREAKKKYFNNKIYIVKYKDIDKNKFDFEYIYPTTTSIKMNLQLNEFTENELLNIIKNKNYNIFYSKYANKLKFKNKTSANLDHNIDKFVNLSFKNIHEDINVIDNNNQTFFYIPFKFHLDEIKITYNQIEQALTELPDVYKFNYWKNNILEFNALLKAFNLALSKEDRYYQKLFNSILNLYKFSVISIDKLKLDSIFEKYKLNLDFKNNIKNVVNNEFIKDFFYERETKMSKIKQRIFDIVKFKNELKKDDAIFI